MNKLLLRRLEETCGASCYHTPSKCDCFGVIPDDVMEDIGLDAEDNKPEDAFYEIEHCPFYDKCRYEICKKLLII